MKKPVVAVDIDDVLSSQTQLIMIFSSERYGVQLTPEDFKRPGDYWGYYERLWDVDDQEGARRFNEFKQEKYPLRQIIEDYVKEAVQKLAERFQLEVVTSRTAEYGPETESWLKKYLPDVFAGVHFVDLWDQPNEKATKAKVCKEIGAGYLIDDNIEHCNLAAEAGVKALLFGEYGWNIGKTPHKLVTPVADWEAVLEYFDGVA